MEQDKEQPRSTEYRPGQVLAIAQSAIQNLRKEMKEEDLVLLKRIISIEKGVEQIYSESSVTGGQMNFMATTIMQGVTNANMQEKSGEQKKFQDQVMILMKKYRVLATDIRLLAKL